MLINFIWFSIGALVMYTLNYIMSLGHSVMVLKQVQQSCAALLTVSEEGLQEVLQLKYMAMKEANRSEQNITAQKYIDQHNIKTMKRSIMRNYVNSFPSTYINTIEYTSWEELEEYVNSIVQKNKGRKQ